MSVRRPHAIEPIETVRYPQKMIFFDCESYEEQVSETEKKQTLRFLCAEYVEKDTVKEKRLFRDGHAFARWVLSHLKKKSTLYIFSHNLYYDIKVSGLLRILTSVFSYEIDSFYENSHGLIITLKKRREQKIIHLLDTLNYFPMPLKKLAPIFSTEKLEVDVFTDDEEKLIEYCFRDVEIIRRAILSMIDFLKQHQLPFGYTAASISMKAFRSRFLKHRIFIHANPEVDELEKQSYYGGRCEAFRIGPVGTTWKLDVNSMYPYVMKNPMPVNLVAYRKNEPVKRLKTYLDRGYLAIAEVFIECREEAFPIRLKQKLLFPHGRFITTLCTPELKYALEKNYVKKVYRVAYYHGADIFSEFVDFFYEKRMQYKKEQNEPYAYFTKSILNSLYGKWAQMQREIVYRYTDEDEDYYRREAVVNGEKLTEVKIFRDVFFIEKKQKPSYNSFIAISAHITSYARMYLYQLMRTAGLENVYYCDTDSLFVNEKGYEKLQRYIHEHELGKLKLEGVKECEIYGAKNYLFGSERKIKGIPKKAWKEGEKYLFWSFEKFRGGLRKERNEDAIYLTLSHRQIVTPYEKRKILPDGRTEAIWIEMEG